MSKSTAHNHFWVYLLLAMLIPVVSACNSAVSALGPPCATQGECDRGMVCSSGMCVIATTSLYDFTDEIKTRAQTFLSNLKARQLNVVTAESLTAGMIISSLVDVPNYGSYIYGGFATYDSDAKRQFLGVKTGNVSPGNPPWKWPPVH